VRPESITRATYLASLLILSKLVAERALGGNLTAHVPPSVIALVSGREMRMVLASSLWIYGLAITAKRGKETQGKR
jgi:uncharacterized membrane protein YecN with MAPEG domain